MACLYIELFRILGQGSVCLALFRTNFLFTWY